MEHLLFIINAFPSCLCRFLNGERIEIESSYNENKYTARLLEFDGKSEKICMKDWLNYSLLSIKEINSILKDHFYNKRQGKDYRVNKKKGSLMKIRLSKMTKWQFSSFLLHRNNREGQVFQSKWRIVNIVCLLCEEISHSSMLQR
jgi:hypothetical protein